jgi:uncharacterized Zn finger protein (UPF0148 family)
MESAESADRLNCLPFEGIVQMFDETIRELQKLSQGITVSISLPVDEEGYFDRQCPSDECQSDFKVHYDDWRDKVRDECVYCPICRSEAPANHWATVTQNEYIKSQGHQALRKKVRGAMERDVRRFNARQRRSDFLKVSMSFKPGSYFSVPAEAAALLERKYTCESCGCRYSSLSAAFFCPACGHNSAVITFEDHLNVVRQLVNNVPHIRETVNASSGEAIAEDTIRHLLENSLARLVGAFQRVAESLFDKLPNRAVFTPRPNVFQNLTEGSGLWHAATGKGYEDLLSPAEMTDLRRLFQQRHLLSHSEGIVDQRYIDRSLDHSYGIGQRLVIREGAVLRLCELVSKLATELQGL